MADQERRDSPRPTVLDVVALLADLPTAGLGRGQVGTVVESLNDTLMLVEFSDPRLRHCTLPAL
jgi:hypothetical protein